MPTTSATFNWVAWGKGEQRDVGIAVCLYVPQLALHPLPSLAAFLEPACAWYCRAAFALDPAKSKVLNDFVDLVSEILVFNPQSLAPSGLTMNGWFLLASFPGGEQAIVAAAPFALPIVVSAMSAAFGVVVEVGALAIAV